MGYLEESPALDFQPAGQFPEGTVSAVAVWMAGSSPKRPCTSHTTILAPKHPHSHVAYLAFRIEPYTWEFVPRQHIKSVLILSHDHGLDVPGAFIKLGWMH